MRRAAAVVVLTAASLFFLFRFEEPPRGVVNADDLVTAPTVPSDIGSTTTTTRPVRDPRDPGRTTVSSITIWEWWGRVRVEITAVDGTVIGVSTRETLPGQAAASGPAVQTGWGRVRLEVTVEDGAVVWISMMEIPADTQRSRVVSRETEPILREEALVTQTADLHVVAGATQFCLGYMRALRGALEAAGL